MEPFIVVRGRLQKDGDTINVIAFRVWPLRLEEDGAEASSGSDAGSRGEPVEMPPAHEWWGPGEETGTRSRWGSRSDPFRFLTALRQTPPGAKNFG